MSLIDGFINKNFSSLKDFFSSLSIEFENFINIVGSNCGILVYENDEGLFEQIADSGYETDFFYSFLSDKKILGNINKSRAMVIYDNVSFYNKDSNYCVIACIFLNDKIKGFLLIEFSTLPDAFHKIFINLFVQKIENVLSNFDQKKSLIRNEYKSLILSNILNNYPFLVSKIEELSKKKFFLISGHRGTGKKTLIKYICSKYFSSVKSIIVNSLPSNQVKLRSIFEHWKNITNNGVIVFNSGLEVSNEAQEFIFEQSLNHGYFSGIFILDTIDKSENFISPHFKSLFSDSHIIMPSLNSFNSELFNQVILVILDFLKDKYQVFDCKLSEDSLKILREHQYNYNITELIFILESVILQADTNIIEVEDIKDFIKYSIDFVDYEVDNLDLRKSVHSMERKKILLSKKLFNGNQIRMSEALGISRGSLQYKMKQYKIL